MLRRPFALIFTSAVLGVLAAHPVQASTMASFRLTNTDAPGASPVMSVLASIVPPGSVVPPNPATSPLTILAGSTGFVLDDLKVSLGEGTTPPATRSRPWRWISDPVDSPLAADSISR